MQKRGIIFGLLVIFILLFSVNVVSAGWFDNWFDDFWSKITGYQVEDVTEEVPVEVTEEVIEEVAEETPPEPEPEAGAEETTDGTEEVTEEVIEEAEPITEEVIVEPEPVPEPEPEERVCCKVMPVVAEPVEARHMWMSKTECSQRVVGANYEIVNNEYCETPVPTPEPKPETTECEPGETRTHTCPDGTRVFWCGCENNAWVCEISPKNSCPRRDTRTCAREIKITFNQDIYYIGDTAIIKIEIFDSQGNPLPDYDFSAKMYDDRWHTPSLETTNDNGYVRNEQTVEEKPGMVFGKIKFKVYTQEKDSCASVQDTAEIELIKTKAGGEEEEEEQDCGIGTCIPEEEEDIVIPEKPEMFYTCPSCVLNTKCYPFGFRKEGKYCFDENNLFIEQKKADDICENNFECKTNICIDGQCMSSGVWQKFLRWINNLIGKGAEPKPETTECSKLLIEHKLGEYNHKDSFHGERKEAQVAIYSDDCTQLGIIKCCGAEYSAANDNKGMAMVCPFNNKESVENLFKCISEREHLVLSEYKGYTVYKVEPHTLCGPDDKTGEEKCWEQTRTMIVWTKDNYVIAAGSSPDDKPLAEEIPDAYLEKYPTDL